MENHGESYTALEHAYFTHICLLLFSCTIGNEVHLLHITSIGTKLISLHTTNCRQPGLDFFYNLPDIHRIDKVSYKIFTSRTNFLHDERFKNKFLLRCMKYRDYIGLITISIDLRPSWKADSHSVRNIPPVMEPEGSLPSSQKHAAGSYPEPDKSNVHPHTISVRWI
jgi:hypothetical protein